MNPISTDISIVQRKQWSLKTQLIIDVILVILVILVSENEEVHFLNINEKKQVIQYEFLRAGHIAQGWRVSFVCPKPCVQSLALKKH